jgi:hypothetical protein
MRRPAPSKILHSELAIRLPACSSTPSQRSLPVLSRTGLTKVVFISTVVKACPGSRVECTAQPMAESRRSASQPPWTNPWDCRSGPRATPRMPRGRPRPRSADLGDLTEGRRRIGGVEKALQEFNPRDATGDLRRHEPELAMRISIVHVRLSLATGKAAVLPHGQWLNGHAAARKRAAASASHHLSTHGRSTTSNAQVDRCWRCSCR